ncbi:MAG TPA: hypothetical protein VMW52_08870, partial [Phycisphaerae bacterium]|nr:hypothetical protein [Phycisphaerae bacterium]
TGTVGTPGDWGDNFIAKKFVDTTAAHWTATTVIRVRFNGSKSADTGAWSAPGGHEEYDQSFEILAVAVFAEFDYKFKAA